MRLRIKNNSLIKLYIYINIQVLLKRSKIFQFFILSLAALTLFSCHNTRHLSAGKAYRNLTAYYNTYFNAKEIYNLAIKKINLANPDHYDRLLSFYKLGDEASAAGLASEMDQVIKKCSSLILKHDRSDWVDDSYLLMGKAYYVKGDYFQSLENFQYIYNTFSNDTIKLAALIWTARTYMQQEKVDEAQQTLDLAFGADSRSIRKNSDELYTTAARFYLNQRDTAKVISMLTMALDSGKYHIQNARYCFMLGQLSSLKGNTAEADKWFARVLKYSPPYEVEFGARLGIAESASGEKAVKASLEKLMKDEKSLEFHDQIYYALARLSQRESHYKEALHLYQLSLANNTSNPNQRGLDYLRMGEIFLTGIKDYQKASVYQDSAMSFLDKDYPNYDLLKIRQQKLSALVYNYRLIDQGDTLLMLAGLSESAMQAKARSMVITQINKQKAEEKATIEAYKKQLAAANANFASVNSAGNLIGSALNRPQVQANSLLSTTGSYSQTSMSSYQPSSSNQMQIYAQGAGTGMSSNSMSGPGASTGSGSGGYSGASSGSLPGSFGGSGSFNQQGSSAGGAYSQGGGAGGFGGNSGGASVPVYGGSTPVYNQQQTGYQNTNQQTGIPGMNSGSYAQSGQGGAGVPSGPPVGGAALYGGQSYNTGGQGSAGSMPGAQGSLQTGSLPNPNQNNSSNPGLPGTPFVANTAAVNSAGTQPGVVYSNGAGQGFPSGTQGNPAGSQNATGSYNNPAGAYAGGSGVNNSNGSGTGAYGGQASYNVGAYPTQNAYNQNAYSGGNGQSQNANSGFYFSNPQAMSMGFSQFLQRWGNRPLRDNWRRSSRGADANSGSDPLDSVVLVKQNKVVLQTVPDDPASGVKQLLSFVPHTQGAKDSLLTNMLFAFGSNAAIYQADLLDYPMAITTYEQALIRYKGDPRTASFAYELYKLYTQTGNNTKAAEERSYIISTFPASLYAKAFLHPEELEPKPKTDSVLEKYYAESYNAYSKHDFSKVLDRSKNIPTVGIGNYLADKFEFLRVLSIGNTRRLKEFEPQLQKFILDFPASPVSRQAQALLTGIDSNRTEYASRNPVLETPLGEDGFVIAMRLNEQREAAAKAEADRIRNERRHFYSNDMEGPYHFLILFSGKKMNLRPIRLNLSQFAAAEFGRLHLQNATMLAAGDHLAMQVGPFKDLKSGLAYYRKFDEVKSDVIPLVPEAYEFYLISDQNAVKLTGPEPLQIYREFFQDEILPYLLGRPIPVKPTAGKKDALSKIASKTTKEIEFSKEKNTAWLVAIVVKDMHTGLNPARLQISLFNKSHFPKLNLRHESYMLGNEAQVITVKYFDDLLTAENYKLKLQPPISEIVPGPAEKVEIVLISTSNYNKLHNLSDLEAYRLFFDKQFKTL